MALALLSRLAQWLKTTASAHKKKLIAMIILVIGYKIARRKIKSQTIISIVMFFVKFWAKVLEYVPIPVDPNFRHIEPFRSVEETEIPQLNNLIDLKDLLLKIKNKEEGSLNQLKISVLSAVVLNLVLYNANSVYDLITRKYRADFSELGAAPEFEQTMALLKVEFLKNISNFRLFVINQIMSQVESLNLSTMVSVKRVEEIIGSLVNEVFSQDIDIRTKVLSRRTFNQGSKQYQVAQNYFKTTREYIEKPPASKLTKTLKLLLAPASLLLTGLSQILKTPEENLTPYRFIFNEYLYILPLKRFSSPVHWPTKQSRFLYDSVMDEMVNFFYSINFGIVAHRHAQFRLRMFVDRVAIYFVKRAKCEEKRLMDLLPIFFKIIQQEMNKIDRRKDFYERELISAFKDTRYTPPNPNLIDYQTRNRILQQIYYKNQLQHLEKDMQAKLYSERDGLTIEPIAQTSRIYEEKDQIQQLMQIHNRADQEAGTTGERLRMMRELAD